MMMMMVVCWELLLVAVVFLDRKFTVGRPIEVDMMAEKPLVRNKYMSPVMLHNADKLGREPKNKHEKLNYRPVENVQGGGRKPAGLNSQPYFQEEKYALVEILDGPRVYKFETEPIMMDEVTIKLTERSTRDKDMTKEEIQPFGTTTVSPPSTAATSTMTRTETEPFLEIEEDVTLAAFMKGIKTTSSETSSGSFTPNLTVNKKISPFLTEKFRLNNGTQLISQDKTRIEVPEVIKTKEKEMEVPFVASYKEKLFEFPPGNKLIENKYPASTSNRWKVFDFLTPNKQKGFELPLLSKQTGFELPPLNRQKGFVLPGITKKTDSGMLVPALNTYKEKRIEVQDISKVKGNEVSALPGAKGIELSGIAEVRGNKLPGVTNESGIKFPNIFGYRQEDFGFPGVTTYKQVEVPAIPRENDTISHDMTKEKGSEFPSITRDKEFYIPRINKGNVVEFLGLTKKNGIEIPEISKEKGLYIPVINKEKETYIGKPKEMHLSNINNEKEIVIPDIKSNKEKGIEVPDITSYKMQYPSMNKGNGIDLPDMTTYTMKGLNVPTIMTEKPIDILGFIKYTMKEINVPSIMTEKPIDIPGLTNYKMKGIDIPGITSYTMKETDVLPITKETGIDIPDITNYKMNAINVPPIMKKLAITDFKSKGTEVSAIMGEKEIVIPASNNNKEKGIGVPYIMKEKETDISGINSYKEKGIEFPFVTMDKGIAITGITSYKIKENGASDIIYGKGIYPTGITGYKRKGIDIPDTGKQQRLEIPALTSYKDQGRDFSIKTKNEGSDTLSVFKMNGLDITNANKGKEIDIPGLSEMKELEIPAITKDKGSNIFPVGIDIPGMGKAKGSEVPTAFKDKGIDMFGISRGIDIPATGKVEGFEIPYRRKYKGNYTPALRMKGIGMQNMNGRKGHEFPSISREEVFENPGVNNEKGNEFPFKGIGTDVPNGAEIKGDDTSRVRGLKNAIRFTKNSKPAKISINNNSPGNNFIQDRMGDGKSSPLVKRFRLRPSLNMTPRSTIINPNHTQPYNVMHSYDYSGIPTKDNFNYRTEENNMFGTQDKVGTYYMLSSYKPPVFNALFNDVIFSTENPTFIANPDKFNMNYPFNFLNISDIEQKMYLPEIYATTGTVGIFVSYDSSTEGISNAEMRTAATTPSEEGTYPIYYGIDSFNESNSNNVNMPVSVPFIFYNFSSNMVPYPVLKYTTKPKPTNNPNEGQIKQEYIFGVENFDNQLTSNVFTSESATKMNDVDFNVGLNPVNNFEGTPASKLFPLNLGPKTSLHQLLTKSSKRKRTTSEPPFTEINAVNKLLFDKISHMKTSVLSNYGTSRNVLDKEYVVDAGDHPVREYNSHSADLYAMPPAVKNSRANRLLNLKLSMVSARTRPTPPRKIIFELNYKEQNPPMIFEHGRYKLQKYRSRGGAAEVTP